MPKPKGGFADIGNVINETRQYPDAAPGPGAAVEAEPVVRRGRGRPKAVDNIPVQLRMPPDLLLKLRRECASRIMQTGDLVSVQAIILEALEAKYGTHTIKKS